MEFREDLAKPGRLRRQVVTVVPIVLMAVVPATIAIVQAQRIGDRMFTGAIMVLAVSVALVAASCLAMFNTYRQSAAMQRQAAGLAGLLSGFSGTVLTMHVVSLIDAPEPAKISWFGMSGSPWWFWLAGAIAGVVVGAVAWLLARPASRPVATEAPPPGAISISLAPRQKAVFTTALWQPTQATLGIFYLAIGVVFSAEAPALGPLLLLFGGVMLGQAHARLFIDDQAVTLVTAGVVRSRVLLEHVSQADALAVSPPAKYFPAAGSAYGFGASTGKGSAFGLRLTDGRHFVFSTPEAETAAGLVNGFLRRDRTHADHD